MSFSVQSINNITIWVQSAACSRSHHLRRFHILIHLSLQVLFIYWLMHLESGFIFDTVFGKASKWIKKEYVQKMGLTSIFFEDLSGSNSAKNNRTFGSILSNVWTWKTSFPSYFYPNGGLSVSPNFLFERVFLGFLDFDSI